MPVNLGCRTSPMVLRCSNASPPAMHGKHRNYNDRVWTSRARPSLPPWPPGIIYVLNLLMGFTMGAVISSGQRRAVVLDGPSMAYFYLRRGMFVVDALASVPLFLLVSWDGGVPFGGCWERAVGRCSVPCWARWFAFDPLSGRRVEVVSEAPAREVAS